jgi:hypothetical protein
MKRFLQALALVICLPALVAHPPAAHASIYSGVYVCARPSFSFDLAVCPHGGYLALNKAEVEKGRYIVVFAPGGSMPGPGDCFVTLEASDSLWKGGTRGKLVNIPLFSVHLRVHGCAEVAYRIPLTWKRHGRRQSLQFAHTYLWTVPFTGGPRKGQSWSATSFTYIGTRPAPVYTPPPMPTSLPSLYVENVTVDPNPTSDGTLTTISADTTPGASCTVDVTYASGYEASSESLRVVETAGASGMVLWSWTPDTSQSGQARVAVSCSSGTLTDVTTAWFEVA